MFYRLMCVAMGLVLLGANSADAAVKARFGKHVPISVMANVIVSSKYFAPMSYSQAYEGIATTVSNGLHFLETRCFHPTMEAVLTGLGIVVRYGVIRTVIASEVARTADARKYPLLARIGNEEWEIPTGKTFLLRGRMWQQGFSVRDSYVSVPETYGAFYPAQHKPHISERISGSSEELEALRTVAVNLQGIADTASLFDKNARTVAEQNYTDFSASLRRARGALKRAVQEHQAYLFVTSMAHMNAGPSLARDMLERAMDSDSNVDLYGYFIARLDGLRYADTPVAREVDRLGRVYGKKDHLYRRFMTYSAIATLLSPGVVNRIAGDAYHIHGIVAWPDVNVWLSRWGLSGSVHTRLRFGDRFELLLGYEGLIEAFVNTDNVDFGDTGAFLDSMGHFFARSGTEDAGRTEYGKYVDRLSSETGRDEWNYAHIFGRAMEECAAQSGAFGAHKRFEVLVGGAIALSKNFGVKVQGYFNSAESVPVGFSGIVTVQAPGRLACSFGIDSISPNSFVGNRLFVYNSKLDNNQKETNFWTEVAIVC